MSKSAQPKTTKIYAEELAWLYGLQRFGIKLGLENAHNLLAPLEPALRRSLVFHVAGTNGKGSVCAMIDAICCAGGRRTGLFTSPHLITFRERIRLNGAVMPRKAATDGLTGLRSRVADWDPHPTFFEITTALALDYFVGKRCDVIILETGLGGRLDATNAVAADISVITPIDLDHQQWLGNTVREIAAEKAGIIKPQTPVISAPQGPEAAEIIRRRAEQCRAPLQFIEKSYGATPIGLRGTYQKWNAALAVAAVRKIEPDISDEEIARGLLNVQWPARFQSFDDRIVLDGAHNPAAARILVQTWQEFFGREKATIIAATLSDKETAGILQALGPIAARFILPRVRSERASEPMELKRVTDELGFEAEIASSFVEAREKALRYPERILITGSLHFAGEALAALQGEPAAYEECAQ